MGLGWALSGLGALRRGAGDHQGALEFGEEARDTHAAYGNLGATSWALFTMAISLSYLGRHDEALEAVDEAMVLLQDITKNFDWGPLVAGVQRRRGDLPAAIDTVIDALSLRELCAAWGGEEQRIANLDTLRSHACRYVE